MLVSVRRVYLSANLHFTLSSPKFCYIFNILRSPQTTSSQVFCDLPRPLCPSTTISLLFFTQLSCPVFQHLYHCMEFYVYKPQSNLSTHQKTFYPSVSHYTSTVPSSCHITHPLYHHHVTLHIHCTIIMSHYTSTVPSSCHITHPLYHHYVTSRIHCTIIMSHYTSTVPSSCHITHPLYHHVTSHIHCTIIMSHYTSTVPSSCHITHPLYHHHVTSHIHCTIIMSHIHCTIIMSHYTHPLYHHCTMSFLSSFTKSSSFTAQVKDKL